MGEILSVGKHDLTVQTHAQLNNGDGLNVLLKREVVGFRANTAEQLAQLEQDGVNLWQYRVVPNEMPVELKQLRPSHVLNRNLDHNWQQALLKTSSERRVAVSWQAKLDAAQLSLNVTSEEGIGIEVSLDGPFGSAKDAEQSRAQLADTLSKLGTTIYYVTDVQIDAPEALFVPNSQLKALRREAIEALTAARLAAHPLGARKPVSVPPPVYPQEHLTFLANVYNEKARTFYQRFGVQLIDAAYEAHEEAGEVPVMITKHCLRFSFNLCPKQAKGVTGVRTKVADMQLIHQDEVLTLKFDCKPCEMHIIGKMKGHILHQPQPGSAASMVGFISPEDLLKTIKRKPAKQH